MCVCVGRDLKVIADLWRLPAFLRFQSWYYEKHLTEKRGWVHYTHILETQQTSDHQHRIISSSNSTKCLFITVPNILCIQEWEGQAERLKTQRHRNIGEISAPECIPLCAATANTRWIIHSNIHSCAFWHSSCPTSRRYLLEYEHLLFFFASSCQTMFLFLL